MTSTNTIGERGPERRRRPIRRRRRASGGVGRPGLRPPGPVPRPRVRLRALLPGGVREWVGREPIAGSSRRGSATTEPFDLVDATVGEVGGRVHLRWRLRLPGRAPGPGQLRRRAAGLRRRRRTTDGCADSPCCAPATARTARWVSTPTGPGGAAGAQRSVTTRSPTSPPHAVAARSSLRAWPTATTRRSCWATRPPVRPWRSAASRRTWPPPSTATPTWSRRGCRGRPSRGTC